MNIKHLLAGLLVGIALSLGSVTNPAHAYDSTPIKASIDQQVLTWSTQTQQEEQEQHQGSWELEPIQVMGIMLLIFSAVVICGRLSSSGSGGSPPQSDNSALNVERYRRRGELIYPEDLDR